MITLDDDDDDDDDGDEDDGDNDDGKNSGKDDVCDGGICCQIIVLMFHPLHTLHSSSADTLNSIVSNHLFPTELRHINL